MDTPHVIAGRFRVECEIGKGGMGTVYRASHLELGRAVAIKVLKPEFAADKVVAERFMREARTMAKLRHSRAAMIFDAGKLPDGRPFIVMEHVAGLTLAETLAREGRFKPERAVRVAAEICHVLAEAHSLGIVHRDLKPSNIMLNERGVCVLDFGIAKVLATSAEETRTHATTVSGLIIGTPRYMSPEQCIGQRVGPESDLYSLGVLLYEMLAGRPPFTDQLASAVLVKQATAAAPPLVALCPEIPRSLALAVHTLLAKNPANRPRNAANSRFMLEKSIIKSKLPAEMWPTPFAATIAALDAGSSAAFRSATVFALTIMLGGLLFAWSHHKRPTRIDASIANQPHNENAPTGHTKEAEEVKARPARASTPAAPPIVALSHSEAQAIATSVLHGGVADAHFLRVRSGQAIAAVQRQPRSGATWLYVLEGRRGKSFRVASRRPLDAGGLHAARWAAEVVDLDGDGYGEVLCTGEEKRRGDWQNRRFVLYVPRARQSYSVRVAPESRLSKRMLATWSPNSMSNNARIFRRALYQRAASVPRTL